MLWGYPHNITSSVPKIKNSEILTLVEPLVPTLEKETCMETGTVLERGGTPESTALKKNQTLEAELKEYQNDDEDDGKVEAFIHNKNNNIKR